MSYAPKPTTPIPTGAHSVVLRSERKPRLEDIRGGFDAAFGGYVPADWTLDAECTRPGVDPEVFFPNKGGTSPARTAIALSICGTCTVREVCLEDAIAFESGLHGGEDVRPEVHGVRGGMQPRARRDLIQKRNVEAQAKLRADVAKAYGEEPNSSVEEIADRFGVQKSSVTRWAKAAGYPARPHRGGRKKQEVA